ncbi:unnamed protein product, partial [Tetraodon nigroviridis]
CCSRGWWRNRARSRATCSCSCLWCRSEARSTAELSPTAGRLCWHANRGADQPPCGG